MSFQWCDCINIFVCSKHLLFQTEPFVKGLDSRKEWTAVSGYSRLTEGFLSCCFRRPVHRFLNCLAFLNVFCKYWKEKRKKNQTWVWIKLLLLILLTRTVSSLCAFSSHLYYLELRVEDLWDRNCYPVLCWLTIWHNGVFVWIWLVVPIKIQIVTF